MGEQMSLFDLVPSTSIKAFEENPKNWVVIDGNNLLNRCYYATSQNPRGITRSPDGRATNAILLFIRMMMGYEKSLNARAVATFDIGKSYRKVLYPAYKDGRNETPEGIKEQLPMIQEMLKESNVPVYMDEEFEADDLIGSFAEQVKGHVYIISNDRDVFQLITERVTVIVRKGKEDVYMTPELFREQYEGLAPKQIIDLKAITGDISDNIKGIKGIGDKGALALLKEYGSIEAMIEASDFPKPLNRYKEKIAEGKENAIFAKKLTTLHTNIALTQEHKTFNKEVLCENILKLGLKVPYTLLS